MTYRYICFFYWPVFILLLLLLFIYFFDCVDLAKDPKMYIQNYFTSLKRINFERHSLQFSPTIALCPRGRNKGVNLATFLTTKVEHFFVFLFLFGF